MKRNPSYHYCYRGFTLTEIMVSMFVFTTMMIVVAQIMSTAFVSQRFTRAVQRDIENAQFALNVIAKELRTSTVVSAAGNQTSVRFFDYSQDKCFQYRISGSALQVASSSTPTDPTSCSSASLGTFNTISTGVITGSFQVTPSAGGVSPVVGKVTLFLDIQEGSTHNARIQTTVSLRDFGVSGL